MTEEHSLPFSTIEDSELVGVRSDPRISSSYISRKTGPVTIRSFISIHMLAIYSNTTPFRKLHCWPYEEGFTHVQGERCSKLCSSVSETTCRVATTRTRLSSPSDSNNSKRFTGPRVLAPYGYLLFLASIQISSLIYLAPKSCRSLENSFSTISRSTPATSRSSRIGLDFYALWSWYMWCTFLFTCPRLSLIVPHQICSKYGAVTDFAFLKRYCQVCMVCIVAHTPVFFIVSSHSGHKQGTNYFSLHEFDDYFGDSISEGHEIWALLPRSFRRRKSFDSFCLP